MENPYKTLYYSKASNQSLSFNKLCNTIVYLLPTSSKQLLIENEVVSIPTPFLNNKPLFNYISFSSQISTDFIDKMGDALSKNDHKYQEKYKLLGQEYYKLFITNSFRYCSETKILQLSEAIERKAGTLIKLIIAQVLLSPKFFSSLTNLVYLKFISSYYNNNKQELQRYLSIAFFSKLLYLKTEYLPRHEVCMLIENSHGNIKNISMKNDHNFEYTTIRLYKAIAINCPKIESLKDEDNRDEILNIIADYSPKTFKVFSFNEDFIISVDGLQIFFLKNGEVEPQLNLLHLL
ncbi:hypothetical protein GLOIN_2v1774410 [Rhizophagus irregularis DAOM 181602=DAOM 197198]|nr:hypothetical protein GLOIN_2v1774410 [Rhizophagus irregularis DAOM 181602=DAOM 197198]